MIDDVEPVAAPNGTNERLRIAAQKAWRSIQQEKPAPTAKSQQFDTSVNELRSEIDDLKQFFTSIRDIPQTVVPGHPGSEQGLRYELSHFYERLLATGIDKNLVVSILKQVQDLLPNQNSNNPSMIQGLIAKTLARKVLIKKPGHDFKLEVFIGAGGHGKTSSLIKRAATLCLSEHKRVAILSTDTKKLGADEQLKIYSQILNIPFMPIHSSTEWNLISDEISNFDHILIDTPGVRFRSNDEIQELKRLLPPSFLSPTTHLVISATSKDQDAIEIGKRFASVGFDDIIFTALDESLQHGVLINFQNFIDKPFHSFGIGPKIPEDFEPATIERVIDLLLGTPIDLNQISELGL
jgi:flagellar biosynthesis protein FlhF